MEADSPSLHPLTSIGPVRRFMIWSGGASPVAASHCPEAEVLKLEMVGLSVLMTAIIAFISGSFAAAMIAENAPLGSVIGLLWCVFIFTLDRGMVSTIKPGGARTLFSVAARVVLASCLALTVSRPIELWVFRNEIASQLEADAGLASARAAADVRSGAAGTAAPLEASTRLQAESTAKDLARCREVEQRLQDDHVRECAGVGLTGEGGDGTECKRTAKFNHLQRGRCDELGQRHDLELTTWKSALEEVERQAELRASTAAAAFSTPSLPMRHGALSKLTSEGSYSSSLSALNVLLFSIFWLIEVIPVLSKWVMVSEGHLDVYFFTIDLMAQHAKSRLAPLASAIENTRMAAQAESDVRERFLDASKAPTSATEHQRAALVRLESNLLAIAFPEVDKASADPGRQTSPHPHDVHRYHQRAMPPRGGPSIINDITFAVRRWFWIVSLVAVAVLITRLVIFLDWTFFASVFGTAFPFVYTVVTAYDKGHRDSSVEAWQRRQAT